MAASIATVARAAPIDSIAASIARPSRVPRARRAAATLGGVLVAPRRDRAPGVRTRAAAGPPASAPSPAPRVLRPRLLSPTSRRALRGVPRAASEETPSEGVTAADTRRVLVVVALAMLLASADRTIFSLASLAIADDLNLTMSAVGLLQSAFFWGYGLTQIIGGVAADAVGGARVLLIGLGLWSVAVALIPASALSPNPIITLIIARALFGAASGCAVPASAAAVAASVPGDRRGGALSFVFGAFNCGSAFGLLLAGGLIAATGWQSVFLAFGGVGLMWSVIGYAALPEAAKRPREPTGAGGEEEAESPSAGGSLEEASSEEASSERSGAASDPSTAPPVPPAGWFDLPRWMYPQLASLAWCHVCINWGFFILQSWLPVYLASELGFSLGGSGVASALPWFLTAAFSFGSGQVADRMIARGTERWRVRRLMMNVATVGPCAALIALPAAQSAFATVACLAAMLCTQTVSIAGYHSYLQDVLPARAGAFLGITNTLGVAAGIAANLLTGYMVETTGSFRSVFLVTAGVYASSGLVWNANMRGRVMFP